MDIVLAEPRGFCAGVIRAIDIVSLAVKAHAPPVYVLHEIVHNRHVVEQLEARGVIFVEDLEDVPHGSVAIFSAHGVSKRVTESAHKRNLHVIDATCPLVTKVHRQGQRYQRQGHELIIIGHVGHPEVEGTRGQIEGTVHVVGTLEEVEALEVENPEHLAYVTQTTLSVDDTRDLIAALNRRFPGIRGPDLNDICYATQNRQDAVRQLAEVADVLLVVGAQNSSNSNRLREVGEQNGVVSYRIESAEDVDPDWFPGVGTIGITAGASAPEYLVEMVVERLKELGATSVKQLDGIEEKVAFPLPEIVDLGP